MKRRILVVDDDRVLRLLVAAMLEDDYEVETAVSARDAFAALNIAAARRDLHDLVLIDNYMPGITGAELVRMLRARPEWRMRPILGCSAAEDPSDLLHAGCCDVVPKPVRREKLLLAVARAFTRCGAATGCAHCALAR